MDDTAFFLAEAARRRNIAQKNSTPVKTSVVVAPIEEDAAVAAPVDKEGVENMAENQAGAAKRVALSDGSSSEEEMGGKSRAMKKVKEMDSSDEEPIVAKAKGRWIKKIADSDDEEDLGVAGVRSRVVVDSGEE
jgi:hypothetical protein